MIDVAAIEALCERVEVYEPKATKGPWHYQSCGEKCYSYVLGNYAPMNEKDTMPPPGLIEVEEYDERRGKYRERYFLDDEVASSESQSGGSDFNFCCQSRLDLPAAVAHLRAALAERQALLAERDRARERVRELEGEK